MVLQDGLDFVLVDHAVGHAAGLGLPPFITVTATDAAHADIGAQLLDEQVIWTTAI